MTEKLRDYSVNGAMIIGVDNGYGNIKTARRCFKTALVKLIPNQCLAETIWSMMVNIM